MSENPTREIAVADIERNPGQPRQWFDENALKELADSIVQHGLLQPIVVRRHPTLRGKFLIVVGERRWRAHKLAGIKKITARVLEGLSDEEAFILSTLENVNRVDMTVIEEANAYAQVMATGRSPAEVAQLFAKTVAMVNYRVSLLNLREDIQHLVAHGQIQLALAGQLARLGPNEQGEVLRKFESGELADEAAASRYISAVALRQMQTGLWAEPEEDAFVQARRRDTRKRFEREIERLGKLSGVFQTLMEFDPDGLAEALAADVGTYVTLTEELARQTARIRTLLANAAASYAASLREGVA